MSGDSENNTEAMAQVPEGGGAADPAREMPAGDGRNGTPRAPWAPYVLAGTGVVVLAAGVLLIVRGLTGGAEAGCTAGCAPRAVSAPHTSSAPTTPAGHRPKLVTPPAHTAAPRAVARATPSAPAAHTVPRQPTRPAARHPLRNRPVRGYPSSWPSVGGHSYWWWWRHYHHYAGPQPR